MAGKYSKKEFEAWELIDTLWNVNMHTSAKLYSRSAN